MDRATVDKILVPKSKARPRIYAYSISDEAHKGLLKVGQTTRDVKQRVAEQLKTAAIKNYTIELDESAENQQGKVISDHEVRAALSRKGFENPDLEWMRCKVQDLKAVLIELKSGKEVSAENVIRHLRCVRNKKRQLKPHMPTSIHDGQRIHKPYLAFSGTQKCVLERLSPAYPTRPETWGKTSCSLLHSNQLLKMLGVLILKIMSILKIGNTCLSLLAVTRRE